MGKKPINEKMPEASQSSLYKEPPSLPVLRASIHAKYPIRHLNSRHKKWIEDLSKSSAYDKSEVIFESGEKATQAAYLLQGSISLKADDGKYKIIHHSDENAQYPLARVNPRQYTATALQPNTVILWIDRKLIKKCINLELKDITSSASSDSYLVEVISEEELANQA